MTSRDRSEYMKAYRAANPSKPRVRPAKTEYNKNYYVANKDRLRASNKEWYFANKAELAVRKKDEYARSSTDLALRARYLVNSCKARAKTKGLPFALDAKDIALRLQAGVCELTGISFDFTRNKGRGPFSPSLDRRVLSEGYTLDNISVVVWALNAARGDWGDDVLWQILAARWPDRVSDAYRAASDSRATSGPT